jgi:hypothetical protein
MSGATRTIQQPAGTGSILVAVGMAALVVAAAAAIAFAVANAGRTTAAPAPAPIFAPAVRDLGARDTTSPARGLANNPVHDLGSREGSGVRTRVLGDQLKDDQLVGGTSPALGYHGFGNRADTGNASSSGSNPGAPATRHAGLWPS